MDCPPGQKGVAVVAEVTFSGVRLYVTQVTCRNRRAVWNVDLPQEPAEAGNGLWESPLACVASTVFRRQLLLSRLHWPGGIVTSACIAAELRMPAENGKETLWSCWDRHVSAYWGRVAHPRGELGKRQTSLWRGPIPPATQASEILESIWNALLKLQYPSTEANFALIVSISCSCQAVSSQETSCLMLRESVYWESVYSRRMRNLTKPWAGAR